MFVRMLLSVLLAAVLGSAAEEVTILLKPESFPPGFNPGFGRPALFRLSPRPGFKVFKVPEGIGEAPRFGTLPMGDGIPGLNLVLDRNGNAPFRYTLLFLDRNGNGDFTDDGKPLAGEQVLRHQRITVNFPAVELPRPPEASPQTPLLGSIRFSFTVSDRAPRKGWFFKRHWMRGEATLNERPFTLVILDHDLDGRYTLKDRWGLVERLPEGKAPRRAMDAPRFVPCRETVTLPDRSSWHLGEVAPNGLQAVLVLGRADRPDGDDALQELLKSSRPPPAEKTVPWMKDSLKAAARSKKEGKPILLFLGADGCAGTRAFLDYTFNDADVVDLAGLFVPLYPEGDEMATARKMYKVPGTPFVLFLDSKFNVLKRVAGFRTAAQFSEDMKSVIE